MTTAADVIDGLTAKFELRPATPPDVALDHVRVNLGRGLPELRSPLSPTTRAVSIVGGGPSLSQTMGELKGCIAAANGSAQYLLDNGIVPDMLAVCDAVEYMPDLIPADDRITYFIASRCHPNLFEKLKGCRVNVWNCWASDVEDPRPILNERRKQDGKNWIVIPGGSTIGLRWINLGHCMGFREFHMHGMDSSYGQWSHAYRDPNMDRYGPCRASMIVRGYPTDMFFARQVPQFMRVATGLTKMDPTVSLHVYGDGLLQHAWREHAEHRT